MPDAPHCFSGELSTQSIRRFFSISADFSMKLIILDRDGVINHDSERFIKSPAEWRAIPGSPEAIARLSQAGYRVVVATNQSGIGRGLFDMETLNAIHTKMHQTVQAAGGRIDAIFYCPHAADAKCDCRKPKPGMLKQIAACFNADLTGVFAVGDSLRDLEAAVSAGASPVLVLTGKGENTYANETLPAGTQVFDDLAQVVDAMLMAEKKAEKVEKAEKAERAEKAEKTERTESKSEKVERKT